MNFRTPLLAAVLSLAALPALAQGTTVDFGDSGHDNTAPVEVTSDQLDVNHEAGTAVFTGNVVVGQANMRLLGDVVNVDYGENALTGETEIRRLHAIGNVTLLNPPEAAEGDEAVYTLETGLVIMTGDVVLTQGGNAIAGDKLTVRLSDNTGVMEGRVKVLFIPGSESTDGEAGQGQ